jgi:epoxyqueuosine reductase
LRSLHRCIDICPTQAITAPYKVDARRCISYLTIELKTAIPVEFRSMIGNRVYGCDDCQLTCPWNRFAVHTREPDFAVRHGLDQVSLLELFGWSEAMFKEKLAGSPIYRIAYAKWLSNLAVGLGNAPYDPAIVAALTLRADDENELVAEPVPGLCSSSASVRCLVRKGAVGFHVYCSGKTQLSAMRLQFSGLVK